MTPGLTYTNTVSGFSEVNADACTTFGAEQLILGLGVELIMFLDLRSGLLVLLDLQRTLSIELSSRYAKSHSHTKDLFPHQSPFLWFPINISDLQTSKYAPFVHIEQLQLATSYSGSGGDRVSEKLMLPQWQPPSYVADSLVSDILAGMKSGGSDRRGVSWVKFVYIWVGVVRGM